MCCGENILQNSRNICLHSKFVSWLLMKANDDDELFLGSGCPTKYVKFYFQPKPLLEISPL